MNRLQKFGVALAASVDPRIQAIDLLDPWGDWTTWTEKSTLIPEAERPEFRKPSFLEPLAPLDPLQWLPALAGRPLKLDDVLYETTTPAEAKAKIEAKLPPSALLVRYATKAQFQQQAIQNGQLVTWIQHQLNAQPHIPSENAVRSTPIQPAAHSPGTHN